MVLEALYSYGAQTEQETRKNGSGITRLPAFTVFYQTLHLLYFILPLEAVPTQLNSMVCSGAVQEPECSSMNRAAHNIWSLPILQVHY